MERRLRRYEFRDVIGPDEYHDHVDNNAFTNYLAAWNLEAGAGLADWLAATHPEHAARLLGPEAEALGDRRTAADGRGGDLPAV